MNLDPNSGLQGLDGFFPQKQQFSKKWQKFPKMRKNAYRSPKKCPNNGRQNRVFTGRLLPIKVEKTRFYVKSQLKNAKSALNRGKTEF